MSNIGVLIETDENGIKAAGLGVITAARAGGTVFAIVFADDGEAVREDLERYGVEKILTVSADGPEQAAKNLAAAAREHGFVALLGVSSARGRDLLARCACELNVPLALDVTGVDLAAGTVTKSHFSGKTTATLKLGGGMKVCGLRPNVVEAMESPSTADVSSFAGSAEDAGRTKVLEVKAGQTGMVDLTEADIIITGGRPMDSADNFSILRACAEQLGAAVGASRAAVDAGFAPHSMQVGQTGKTVSPKLYIGCGLSGSVQHFAGMKTSKVIVGINTDRDAPIFGKCDYGLVADLFDVVPALTETLKVEKG